MRLPHTATLVSTKSTLQRPAATLEALCGPAVLLPACRFRYAGREPSSWARPARAWLRHMWRVWPLSSPRRLMGARRVIFAARFSKRMTLALPVMIHSTGTAGSMSPGHWDSSNELPEICGPRSRVGRFLFQYRRAYSTCDECPPEEQRT